ncbi:uncharacterized protein LOC129600371 [Paramacrobiotus metropolitanus]|uniref:uncharacterized protein LOC129600371 n=1 Tax=Paramacrobiotus metropolitanus TaxID=2943436 RepID=UPI002445F3A9|nr:uncharacterized protein LOC129600371 [Paramacrobiotus metropolitanus]
MPQRPIADSLETTYIFVDASPCAKERAPNKKYAMQFWIWDAVAVVCVIHITYMYPVTAFWCFFCENVTECTSTQTRMRNCTEERHCQTIFTNGVASYSNCSSKWGLTAACKHSVANEGDVCVCNVQREGQLCNKYRHLEEVPYYKPKEAENGDISLPSSLWIQWGIWLWLMVI